MPTFGRSKTPTPLNEPVRVYAPGSPERAKIKAELERQANMELEVPLRINGQRWGDLKFAYSLDGSRI